MASLRDNSHLDEPKKQLETLISKTEEIGRDLSSQLDTITKQLQALRETITSDDGITDNTEPLALYKELKTLQTNTNNRLVATKALLIEQNSRLTKWRQNPAQSSHNRVAHAPRAQTSVNMPLAVANQPQIPRIAGGNPAQSSHNRIAHTLGAQTSVNMPLAVENQPQIPRIAGGNPAQSSHNHIAHAPRAQTSVNVPLAVANQPQIPRIAGGGNASPPRKRMRPAPNTVDDPDDEIGSSLQVSTMTFNKNGKRIKKRS